MWCYAYMVVAIVGLIFGTHDAEGVAKALLLAVVQAALAAAVFVAILPRRKKP